MLAKAATGRRLLVRLWAALAICWIGVTTWTQWDQFGATYYRPGNYETYGKENWSEAERLQVIKCFFAQQLDGCELVPDWGERQATAAFVIVPPAAVFLFRVALTWAFGGLRRRV